MEVRLIGTFEQVETVTRELRQLFAVEIERDCPAVTGGVRRYLSLDVALTPALSPSSTPPSPGGG